MRRGEAGSSDLLLLYPTLLKRPSEIPAEVLSEVGHSRVWATEKIPPATGCGPASRLPSLTEIEVN